MATSSGLPPIIHKCEVHSAPMEDAGKDLVILHINRQENILSGTQEAAAAINSSKRQAREKLARMTLVFRDYMGKYDREEIDNPCESMATDLVDCCHYKQGKPSFSNPLLDSKQREITGLMQELKEEDNDESEIDDDEEGSVPVPPEDDAGPSVPQSYHQLKGAVSEDRLLHSRGSKALVKNRKRVESRLRGPWRPGTALPPKGEDSESTFYSATEDSDWD